ncbi:MAG: SMC-Scp complex subunit ScpB [Clostridia bacterium]|nr:SMC-Scp complex subunit ScpB [Clostridia bacterium]
MEAILFAAGHPMPYDKLAAVTGHTVSEVKVFANDLAAEYADRGIGLFCFPDSCQLATRETYASEVREALGIRRGGNLSASSMEVLAVVAYNQPITRSYIDTIRGVDSSYAVGSLLDKGLIEASGRLDAPGRPMLYVTTEKFLRVFGLHSLEDLPETEALSTAEAQLEISKDLLEKAQDTEEKAPGADYEAPKEPEEEVIFERDAEPEDTNA